MHKTLQNTEQLFRKSAFLNKYKPEQRTGDKLAQGNEAESITLSNAQKQ